MNAMPTAAAPSYATDDPAERVPMIGLLRALLIGEVLAGIALAVFLSLVAGAVRGSLGGDEGQAADDTLRFAAGGSFVFAILEAFASRGARRRRGWAWTLAAILQVLIAIGTGIAVLTVEWHPLFLVGFALAALVMLVLSTTPVRRALGQS